MYEEEEVCRIRNDYITIRVYCEQNFPPRIDYLYTVSSLSDEINMREHADCTAFSPTGLGKGVGQGGVG